MSEYVFRIEKRDPKHPLTPKVLAEFGCDADNPRAVVESVVAFGELLKMHKSPEKVVEWMRRNADIQRAKLLLESSS